MENRKTVDLRYATNMFGESIDKDCYNRIINYFNNPTYSNWDDIHGIILNESCRTLWQAVVAIDSTFPKTGRKTTLEGKIIEDWQKIPTPEQIIEAIFFATH